MNISQHICILTFRMDSEARFVELALREHGHQVTRWFSNEFPSQQTAAVAFDSDQSQWELSGRDIAMDSAQAPTVVWARRPVTPTVFKASVHPDDFAHAQSDCEAFYKGLLGLLPTSALWVNPYWTQHYFTNKLVQLRLAQEVGLSIPPTLVTNQRKAILAFAQRHQEHGIIAKTLTPNYWRDDTGMTKHAMYTRPVDLATLEACTSLHASPMIFQAKVPKAFELRVTFFGRYAVAARIDSQQLPGAENDWRVIRDKAGFVDAFELPAQVKHQCHALMQRLGMVFGCFDLIVTPDNEYIFLEVNEQGQSLFLEGYCPEVRMLEAFVGFFGAANPDYAGPTKRGSIRLADYQASDANKKLFERDEAFLKELQIG